MAGTRYALKDDGGIVNLGKDGRIRPAKYGGIPAVFADYPEALLASDNLARQGVLTRVVPVVAVPYHDATLYAPSHLCDGCVQY